MCRSILSKIALQMWHDHPFSQWGGWGGGGKFEKGGVGNIGWVFIKQGDQHPSADYVNKTLKIEKEGVGNIGWVFIKLGVSTLLLTM